MVKVILKSQNRTGVQCSSKYHLETGKNGKCDNLPV